MKKKKKIEKIKVDRLQDSSAKLFSDGRLGTRSGVFGKAVNYNDLYWTFFLSSAPSFSRSTSRSRRLAAIRTYRTNRLTIDDLLVLTQHEMRNNTNFESGQVPSVCRAFRISRVGGFHILQKKKLNKTRDSVFCSCFFKRFPAILETIKKIQKLFFHRLMSSLSVMNNGSPNRMHNWKALKAKDTSVFV